MTPTTLSNAELDLHIQSCSVLQMAAYARYEESGDVLARSEAYEHLLAMNDALRVRQARRSDELERLEAAGLDYFSAAGAVDGGREALNVG